MVIYGVALLASCLLVGMLAGEGLGLLLGVSANVGGVGIAMLMLVLACNSTRLKSLVDGASGTGIKFWSAMYIPIVVAMAASQNVAAAAAGGLLALVAGSGAVVVSFALVPVLSRIGSDGGNGGRSSGNAGDTNSQGSTDKSNSETGVA
jgi:malonate transporter MadL subunit